MQKYARVFFSAHLIKWEAIWSEMCLQSKWVPEAQRNDSDCFLAHPCELWQCWINIAGSFLVGSFCIVKYFLGLGRWRQFRFAKNGHSRLVPIFKALDAINFKQIRFQWNILESPKQWKGKYHHKSRKGCQFLAVFKWSIMFYPSFFLFSFSLTFPLCLLPRWVTGHWSPCSATCEKGIQRREVTCVYQLQNGTYVNTRDLYCLGNKPATVQSCEGRDCLSIWEASEWSKVGGTRFKNGSRQHTALDTLALT